MLDLVQGSPSWHEFRRNHIGSADSGVIMEVSPWKSPLELYNEKVNCTQIPNASNFAMRRGLELEPQALALFEAETGYLMMPRVLVHPTIDFMSASLDGMELSGKAAVEIKAPGMIDHQCALDGRVPEKYIPQIQHQMEVARLNKIYYMSYVSDSDYKILEISKDHDYTKTLLQKEYEFWQRVIEKKPPEFTKKDYREIQDQKWGIFAKQYQLLLSRKEENDRHIEAVKEKLIDLADGQPSLGFGLKLSKVTSKGRVDFMSIPEIKGLDLEKYRKPDTESWRITINGNS
jgi:putative phage-type endonuclease